MSQDQIAKKPALVNRLEAGRRVLFKSFVRDHGLLLGSPVHESEIRQLYEERRQVLYVPESYTLRHAYVRVAEGAPERDWQIARDKALEIRALMIASGADLDAIIGEHSDSEDASQGGWIRGLRLGVLDISSSFEDGVRSLQPGEVSPPIETRRGYQIVVLVDHHQERQLSYEEVRQRLLNELLAQRRSARQSEVIDRLRVEDPLEFDLAAFLEASEEAIVIRGRDLAISRATLKQLEPGPTTTLQQSLEQGGDRYQGQVDAILQELWLVRYGQSLGLDADPQFLRQWEDLRYRTIVDHVFEATYAEWLSGQQRDQLRAFFEENRSRFTTPRQLRLKILFLKHEVRDRYATFDLAERLLRRLEAGEPLEPLVARYSSIPGPQGDGDFGWNTHKQIAARGKMFYDAVLSASPGRWFGPVNWEQGYAVIRVEEIREPEPLDFDQAEQQVRRAYSRRMAEKHRETLIAQAFDQRGGQLNEKYFEGLR
jgi:parvulin-like peptidyl-prolyl isomerase